MIVHSVQSIALSVSESSFCCFPFIIWINYLLNSANLNALRAHLYYFRFHLAFNSIDSKLSLLYRAGLVNCVSTHLHLPLSDIFNRQLAQLADRAVVYNALNLLNLQISSLICQQTTVTRAVGGPKATGCNAPLSAAGF